MIATVARTGSFRPEATTGRFSARVTHTLLFLAAAVVPPGVCDACPACPTRAERSDSRGGLTDRAAGSRQEGLAAAVAGFHRCGSCASTTPCMPTGRSPADRMPPDSVDRPGDGAPSSGGPGCHCQWEARDLSDLALAASPTTASGAGPAVAAWPAIQLDSDEIAAVTLAVVAESLRPDRPVRVLYGVWRN
jgi:hypothetical protein